MKTIAHVLSGRRVPAAAAMVVAISAGLLQAFQASAATLPSCISACTAFNPGLVSTAPSSTIIQQVPSTGLINPLPCIGPVVVQDPGLIIGPGPVEIAQMADVICPPDPTPPPTCVAPQVLSNGTCVDPPPPTCVAPQVLSNGTCVDPPPPTCVAPQVLLNGACVTPVLPPQVKPPAPVADTGSDNGGTDVQAQTDTAATSTADVVVPLIKPTPPQKPPRLTHRAPHTYGTVRLVATGRIHNGLKASFSFGSRPTAGAQLQTTWYYNNKPIGKALKTMRATITTSVQSSSPLPAGYWRCTLRVKLPNGPWRELQDARQLLH